MGIQDLFSAGKIAKELEVPAKVIKNAIESLSIEPDVIKGNCKYYTKETVQKIKVSVSK